ncbi:hypothetical protein [Actinoplanes sp. L3-i22]|uniref:hypothetical protein n=1 Tax=Actinoplanes sp. L3-i22 TaxID=2836373 RepID=UPI001C84D515|nr:hypothetical protein [Actinoplanes sp. L3-i22]
MAALALTVVVATVYAPVVALGVWLRFCARTGAAPNLDDKGRVSVLRAGALFPAAIWLGMIGSAGTLLRGQAPSALPGEDPAITDDQAAEV